MEQDIGERYKMSFNVRRYFIVLIIVLATAFIYSVKPARAAYIDPNTGGMLFQMLAVLIGVFSGIVLIFSSRIKMLYFRIARFLRRSDADEAPQDQSVDD